MLKQKHTSANLTGWKYARGFLDGVYECEYLADTWPERLGVDDIACLQAAGETYQVFEAWSTCLRKAAESGELVTGKEFWWLGSDEPSEYWTRKKQRKILIPPCHKPQEDDDILFFGGGALERDTVSPQDFADYLQGMGEQPSKYIAAWFDAFVVDMAEPDIDQQRAAGGCGEGSSMRVRKDNLTRAIEAAIKLFECKPSLDELWQFFLNDKDETGIIQDYKEDSITWVDTKGKFHDTTKKALANRLTAY